MLIEFDNTVALLKAQSQTELDAYALVRKQTKTDAPGARYMYQHKLYLMSKGKRGWDGKASILSKTHPVNKFAIFPTGLLPLIYNKLAVLLTANQIQLNDLRANPNLTIGSYTVPLFDYQADTLNKVVNNTITLGGQNYYWPAGVIQIATGGGKTELAVALCQAISVPTVFVVHRKHLMTQAVDRFAKYGITAGQIGDGIFNPNPTGITVATVQTLHNLLNEGDLAKVNQFIKARQLFFDEAHLCASKVALGNQFVMIARQFRHAFYRWGLTATPFMKDEYSNQLLMGCTGDLLCQVSNEQLITAGRLTPPKVVIIKVPEVKGPTGWPDVYDSAIVLNRWRNLRIIEELVAAPKPAMVMCSRLGHAKVLHNLAISKGISVPAVLCGDTPNKDRKAAIQDLQSGKTEAIICTTIFDEGMDAPELLTLIMAGGGKSTVAQLQRLGRGLRTAPGKEEVLVIDFKYTSGAIMKRHSAARRKIWKEQGFNIEERE